MTKLEIKKAERRAIWGRVFLHGPGGSGKSRGAFELASRMFGGDSPITYANTERDRDVLYADRYEYDLINLVDADDFSPETFIGAIDLAERTHPGGTLILDSVSHEWMGEGGVLQLADRFGEWKVVRPRHNAFVQRIQNADCHVIVVCRSKMKYEQIEEEGPRGKRYVVNQLGVGPIQDDGLQYEFTLTGSFETPSHLVTFGGHCDALAGQVFDMVENGQAVADEYTRWLSEGTPIVAVEYATDDAVDDLRSALLGLGVEAAKIDDRFAVARKENRGKLPAAYVADQTAKAKAALTERARKAQGPAEPSTEPAADGEGPAAAQEALTAS